MSDRCLCPSNFMLIQFLLENNCVSNIFLICSTCCKFVCIWPPHPKLRMKYLALAGFFLPWNVLNKKSFGQHWLGRYVQWSVHSQTATYYVFMVQRKCYTKSPKYYQSSRVQYHLCYKLGSFINTLMTQMCSLKCGPILIEWQELLFFLFMSFGTQFCVVFIY